MTNAQVRADLKRKAKARTTGFDAYRNAWDRPIWLLIQVDEDFGTPLGKTFKMGDVTLARYGRDIPGTPIGMSDTLFAYSFRSGAEAAIHRFAILEQAQ